MQMILPRLLAVVPKRVSRATNGGNLSPTALRVLLAARPFLHPLSLSLSLSRGKGRILALAKSVFLAFAWTERLFIIVLGASAHTNECR